MTELDHIREAIRRGLLTDLTRQMLEEAEARVRDLRAKLENPVAAQLHALRLAPRVVEARLAYLDRVLGHDVDLARDALKKVLGEITLGRPRKGWWLSSKETWAACSLWMNRPPGPLVSLVAGAYNPSYPVGR